MSVYNYPTAKVEAPSRLLNFSLAALPILIGVLLLVTFNVLLNWMTDSEDVNANYNFFVWVSFPMFLLFLFLVRQPKGRR